MTLDDFLPFVLPSAKDCPDITALFAIRNAIIELCRKALVWTEYQPAITSLTGVQAYAYTPAVGQQVCKLLGVKVNTLGLPVYDPAKAIAMVDSGLTEAFAYGRSSNFTINPVFAAGLPIVTFAAVCPTLTADTVTDDMGRFAKQIGRGALCELLATPKKDYTDMRAAASLGLQWADDIGTARVEAHKGFARAYPRTAASWF